MARGRFISYLRVSTAKQGASGLGLEAQRKAVLDYLDGGKWTLVAEVVEIETGKRADRPKLAEALALCRLQRATLVIAKLDRLARNVAFISNLMESGVDFVAVDLPQANRLTVHILAAVAEHEAKMISERTRAALAAAKARGQQLGGDRGNIREIAHLGRLASAQVRQERARQRAADLVPIIADLRKRGVTSLRQIAAALNERGVPAPCGGAWAPAQVHRVLDQYVDEKPNSPVST
jgi:DNA invertase Pin-like site-specific DNA recombinase